MPPNQEELESSPRESTVEDSLPYVFIDNTSAKDQIIVSQQPTSLSYLAEQHARAVDLAGADARGGDDWLGFSGEESMLSHSFHSSWNPENNNTDISCGTPAVGTEMDAFSLLDQYHKEQTQFIETYLDDEEDYRSETIDSSALPPPPPPEPSIMSEEPVVMKDPAPTVVASKPLLSQLSIEDGELLPSQPAVVETEATPTLSLNGTTVSVNNDTHLSDGEIEDCDPDTDSKQLDVEGIVKGRLDEMLKLKDPKLLQSAPFRALMLLLRCIKFGDPEKMYAAVKAAPFPVASQLNELATEFDLVLLSDACTNALLSTSDAGNKVAVSERATPAPSLVSQVNQVESSDSESMDMETQPSSTSSSPSLHGNDTSIINGVLAAEGMGINMDVDVPAIALDSSAMGGQLAAIALPPPALPTSSMATTHTTIFSLAGDPITPTTPRSQVYQPPSREVTPLHQMHSRFSRSRAPSPPSAQPRTPSRHFTSVTHSRPFEHALNLAPLQSMRQFDPEFAASIGAVNVNGHSMVSQSVESSSPELMGNRSDERAISKSEYDRLVVYLAADECDLSDASDVDDLASNPEMETDLERFHKQENSIMNRMCRKLAALPDQRRGMDSGSGTPLSTTSANLSRLSLSGGDSSDKSGSSTALIKAKENLKAQENAIAKLKAQIDRKQRVASLRKKLRESKANNQQNPQAETPSDTAMDSTSAPASPNRMDAELTLPEPNMSTPVAPVVDVAMEIEEGEVSNSHDMAGNATPTTITSGYPRHDECKKKYIALSIDVRAKHVEEVTSTLADVKAKKGKELKLAEYKHRKQQAVPECISFLLDTRRQSESLDKRRSQLEIREVEIKKLLGKLQAELDVVSLEKRIIDCGASIDSSVPISADNADTDIVATLIREVSELTELINMFKWLPTNATDTTPADSITTQPSPKPSVLIGLAKENTSRNLPSSSVPPLATQQDKGKAAERLSSSVPPPATNKDKGKKAVEQLPDLSVLPAIQQDKGKVAEKLPSPVLPLTTHDIENTTQMATDPSPASNNQTTNSSSKAASLRSKIDALEKSTTQVLQRLESQIFDRKRRAADAYIGGTAIDSPNKRPKGPSAPQQLSAQVLLNELIKSLHLTVEQRGKGSAAWPRTWQLPADDCIIQPLPIVDNAHMSKMVDLTTFFFPMVQSRFIDSKEKSTSHSPVSDVSKGLHAANSSPLSSKTPSISTPINPVTKPLEQDTEFLTQHMDVWSKATEADLRKAVAPQPVDKQGYLTQLQVRLRDALRELLYKGDGGGDSSLSYAKIAMTIFRVYSNYALCGGKVNCNDILFLTEAFESNLGVDQPYSVDTYSSSITNFRPLGLEDEKQLNIFIQSSDDVLPILNQDLLKLTYFVHAKEVAQKNQKGVRYFEKSGKGNQQNTASGSGPALDAEEEEEAYKQAFELLWKDFPAKPVEEISEADILAYIGAKRHSHIGKAATYLGIATNRLHQSERLWDLLLELLVHRDNSAKMVSKRFTSATKAIPQSARIWQRYVYWCWHNSRSALRNANGSFDKWPRKLSEAIIEAMKSICGNGDKEQGQQLSVDAKSLAVTSMLVYYWDTQWMVLEVYCIRLQTTEAKDKSKKISARKTKLIAHMGACIRSQTVEEMVKVISGYSGASSSESSAVAKISTAEWWKEGQRALVDWLLPHHLLLLTQVYFASYVSGSFIPATVFSQMLAASCLRLNQHMAYYIDIDMLKSKNSMIVAPNGGIKPDVVNTLSGLFGLVGCSLKRHGVSSPSGSKQTDRVINQSTRVCCESLFATLSCADVISSSNIPNSQLRTYDICLSSARSMSIPAILDSTFLDDMVNNDPDKCLPITVALCRGEYRESLKEVGWRVVFLREHAAKLARRLGIVKGNQYERVSCEFLKTLPDSSVDNSSELRKRLEVLALDARKLYYKIINYRGPAVPDLCATIMKNIHSPTHITSQESLMIYSRLMGTSGIWINIALTQLLVFYLQDGNKGNSIADWAISLRHWLRYGNSCVDGKDAGMGAQLLAVSFQLKLLYATLEGYSFSTLEKTLERSSDDTGGLHREPSNYILVNSVLDAILRCNPTSKETLQCIGEFLEKRIPEDMEMRVRFVKYASGLDKSDYDVRELFERMKRELPISTLLTDMRINLYKSGE